MSAELPMYLKQLEALPSALDIIRFVAKHPRNAADVDDICDALTISERRASKAIRRLVTNHFLQMRSDYSYELGRKGAQAAFDLAEYDMNAPDGSGYGAGKIARDLFVALPRYIKAKEAATVYVGFAEDANLESPLDIVLRFDALYATLSTQDEMIKLGASAHRQTLTLTPDTNAQARLRVRVFQLSPDGDDLSDCGGMYVDIDVTTEASDNRLVAYQSTLFFTAD